MLTKKGKTIKHLEQKLLTSFDNDSYFGLHTKQSTLSRADVNATVLSRQAVYI